MPDVTGDEALAELRDRGYDVPVAFLSAVEPDVDLLDMDCTEYLSKPVRREEIQEAVARLIELSRSDPKVREYYQLVAKQRALNESSVDWRSKVPDRYEAIQSKIDALREEVDPYDAWEAAFGGGFSVHHSSVDEIDHFRSSDPPPKALASV